MRTLHHYDDIGLLTPTKRRPNGYRAYTDGDVSRLQQILAYRELDLGLEEIARILDEPSDTIGAFSEARRRIDDQLTKLSRIAASLDAAIESEKRGTPMTPDEKLEAFVAFDPDEFADEAEERWGGTGAFRESARRTSAYTSAEWKRQAEETDEIYQALLALMAAGTPADSPRPRHSSMPTGPRSQSCSTTAPPRSTPGSVRCTLRTNASDPTSTSPATVSPSTCPPPLRHATPIDRAGDRDIGFGG